MRHHLTPQRWLLCVALAAVALLGCAGVGLAVGSEPVSLLQALGAASDDPHRIILLQVRLPRVLLAIVVGAALSASGGVFQAVLRNPLADPYILGISAGAGFGIVLAGCLHVARWPVPDIWLPLFALAGAFTSVAIVYAAARMQGHLPPHTLLLAGVIVGAVFSAGILLLTTLLDPTELQSRLAWLVGNLTTPRTVPLAAVGATVAVIIGWLTLRGRDLNLLSVGEEAAAYLGTDVDRLRRRCFFLASLATALVVSLSGLVGFVGLVVPHAVRRLFGADHRLLLPMAALLGGGFLTLCDALARTVSAPTEHPVGIVTALVGGPFFLWVLRREGARSC